MLGPNIEDKKEHINHNLQAWIHEYLDYARQVRQRLLTRRVRIPAW